MFKRVEKRRRKKQEEEELGLDEDMKEVLGIQDTDSEESASESDSDSEDGNNLVEEEEMEREDEDIEGADIDNTDEDDEQEEEEEDPNISVSQALDEPVYVVSVLPEVKSCIVCPGKLLKSAKMVQLHRTSNACTLSLVHLTFQSWLTSYIGSQAHERRFKLLKQLSLNCDRNESAWEVMKRHAVEKQQLSEAASANANSISRRAEKKKAQQARRKSKREIFKARQAAKKAAAAITPDLKAEAPPIETPKASGDSKTSGTGKSMTSPPKKRRKVGVEGTGKPTPGTASKKSSADALTTNKSTSESKESPSNDAPASPSANTEDVPEKSQEQPKVISVKSIVWSTSDRAKNARSKALKRAKSSTKDDKASSKKAVRVS